MLNFGVIPDGFVIDHIDRNPSNNKIANLRAVPQAINLRNVGVRSHCRSGEKYINTDNRTGRYTVRINRKTYGTYASLDDAISMRNSIIGQA